MSIELRMSKYRNGRKSRLYKKTKRASMNKIDATHLPMRVQSEKNGYWGQTSSWGASLPYNKVKKFLLANIGRPVNKVYTEFLTSARKHTQVESLKELFEDFINGGDEHRRMNWRGRGYFYITNGILNYRKHETCKKLYNESHIRYNHKHHPEAKEMTEITLKLSYLGPQPLGKMFVIVRGNLLFLPVYLVSKVRWESLQNPTHQIIGIYGKFAAERIKEYTLTELVGYGDVYSVVTWQSLTYEWWKTYDYFYYVVKIADIEAYKKEKYKL